MSNRTILQGFEWFLSADAQHWNRMARNAAHLARLGITDVWLPPAYKGHEGINDVGYGVYNLYDLGIADAKGTIPTKYGTMEQYFNAIRALQRHGISVLADIVLNHRMGEDGWETVTGRKVLASDRTVVKGEDFEFEVPTHFDFPGVEGVYPSKTLTKDDFISSDRKNHQADKDKKYVFKFNTDEWSDEVSDELGNYQYLMGVGMNFKNPNTVAKLLDWGCWYFNIAGFDGVRLDALKHIPYSFYNLWLDVVRAFTGRDFFAVGEYWEPEIDKLAAHLEHCNKRMTLFDVPLHNKFHAIANALNDPANNRDGIDLRQIFDDTLLSRNADHTVTFVDNHDTVPGQGLASWVEGWFKPLAYALILLQDKGIPCVFFGDLYGLPHNEKQPVPGLWRMMQARRDFGNGGQYDDDEKNTKTMVGWSRDNRMAVVMSIAGPDHKRLPAGQPGEVFVDLLGNHSGQVVIGDDGWADFPCAAESVSVWVSREYAENVK